MKTLMYGAMMTGLLGLAGAGSTTAQVVQADGWWSTDYKEGYAAADRGRRGGGPRGDVRIDRERGRVDVEVYEGRRGRGSGEFYEDDVRGRGGVRGRVEVRVRDGRVGYRQPGRVRVVARPALRYRGHVAPRVYWSEVYWDVRFRDRFMRDVHYGNGYYDHRGRRARLKDIVGNRTVKELRRHRNRLGLRGELHYRWSDLGRRGLVLQVRVGRMPLAEFIDFRGDGYVDVVRLSQGIW